MAKNKVNSHTSNWSRKKLLMFALISVLLILIVLEIIFRIVFIFDYRYLHTSIAIQGSPLQQPDSLLVFKNSPFYVDYNRQYQNNEEGMKSALGDEFIDKKKPNDFWVLLTGGSAMEGMGSNQNGEWLDITGVENHPYEETIAYYLQQLLQKKMPQKRVRVFNAATSSYTIHQSLQRYLGLEEKIKPDWVISMDGVNDPASLSEGQTTEIRSLKEWQSRPQFKYPLKAVIPLTSHSALTNAIKQKIFYIKHDGRLQKARQDGFPARKKWALAETLPISYAEMNADIERGINSFMAGITKYDSILGKRNRKYLLLIQPYMAFRDTSMLTPEEKAVNNYYRSTFADSAEHLFLRSIYDHFPAGHASHKNIISMDGVHSWRGWIFVDYCHFTDEAIKRISTEIYNYIVTDGKADIFRK